MGEVVLVKNGAKVPVDGEVIAGSGAQNAKAHTQKFMDRFSRWAPSPSCSPACSWAA